MGMEVVRGGRLVWSGTPCFVHLRGFRSCIATMGESLCLATLSLNRLGDALGRSDAAGIHKWCGYA
jgi:hypothetical protein